MGMGEFALDGGASGGDISGKMNKGRGHAVSPLRDYGL
jgi:hypothetical protein